MTEPNLNMAKEKYMPGIPFRRKLTYGFGAITEVITDDFVSAFTLFFLTDAAGMDPVFSGLIITVMTIMGAVSDFLVGPLSDRTRSRLGRRHPWMLGAIIPWCAAAIFIFTTWDSMGEVGKNIYYTSVIFVYWISYSCWLIPYNALGSTLSLDDTERSKNRIFAMLFQYFGYFLSGAVPTASVAMLMDNGRTLSEAWHTVALVLMLLGAVMMLVCCLTTRNKEVDLKEVIEKQKKTNIIQDAIMLCKIRAFRVLVLFGTFMFRIAYGIASIATLYFFLDGCGFTEADISIYYTINSLSGIAFTAIMYKLAERVDNFKLLIGGTLFMGIWVGLFTFIPITGILILAVYALIRQMGSTVYWVMILPVMYQINEIVEFKTGQRKEATVQSMYGLVQKLGYAASTALGGILLGAIGYDGTLEVQTEATQQALQMGYPATCSIFILITVVFFKFYPVRKNTFETLNTELMKKREGLEYSTEGIEHLLK